MFKYWIPVAAVLSLSGSAFAQKGPTPGGSPSDLGNAAGKVLEGYVNDARYQGCSRWLYNPGGFTWKITPPPALASKICGEEPGSCLAHPYMGAPIHYPSFSDKGKEFHTVKLRLQGFIADNMDVSKPKTIVFDQEIEVGDETEGNHPCAIFKGSDPAGVSLNGQSKGDIVVCGSSYDHAATWTHLNGTPCHFSVKEPTLADLDKAIHSTPGTGMYICADKTKVDQMTYDKDHCASHGGICRIGCDTR
jgi:hypothetical protein